MERSDLIKITDGAKGTLIKIAVVALVLVFILELFFVTPRVTPTTVSTQNQTNSTASKLYAVGDVNATLVSYSDYLVVFSGDVDISSNSSLVSSLSKLQGVAYVSPQQGALAIVLASDANMSVLRGQLRDQYPEINVSAIAYFLIPGTIQFYTSAGPVNVTVGQSLRLTMDPELSVGGNVTLRITGLIQNNTLIGQPTATILPEQALTLMSGVVAGLTNDYRIGAYIDWRNRSINETLLVGEISKRMQVLQSAYIMNSSVVVDNLSSSEAALIENLSYVNGVVGDEIMVKPDFVDEDKVNSDITGIVGNKSIGFIDSEFAVEVVTDNFSESFLNDTIKPKGALVLTREGTVTLSDYVVLDGVTNTFATSRNATTYLYYNATLGQPVDSVVNITRVGTTITGVQIERVLD